MGVQTRMRHPYVNSPTHKCAEGRAPVWGSEFTTKAATLQGGSEDFAAG